MKPRFAEWLATILLPLPALALAQSFERTTARDARKARLDARELRATTKAFMLEAIAPTPAPTPPSTTLSLGLAIDTDEADTRTVTTPFTLTHQRGGKEDWWKFRVAGDGYTRSRKTGADTVDGLADVQFKVLHPFGAGFTGAVGVTLPTKRPIGSGSASQSVKLLYEHNLGKWTGLASGSISHANGALEDKSPYTKVLYAELSRSLNEGQDLIANITHTRRGGTASITELGVEYDFPLPFIEKKKAIDAAVSLVRGITNGSRHTAVEFDLSHKF